MYTMTKNNPKMTIAPSSLIILDMQERLIANIGDKEIVTWNIARLIEAAGVLNIYRLFTEQNPLKLGATIRSLTNNLGSDIFTKMTFSALGNSELEERLESCQIKKAYLAGVETHICIMQTAIDLINRGYKVYVVADAVGARKPLDHQIGLKRLEQEGAIITTTESVLFEWCLTAERAEFKEISRLAKESEKI